MSRRAFWRGKSKPEGEEWRAPTAAAPPARRSIITATTRRGSPTRRCCVRRSSAVPRRNSPSRAKRSATAWTPARVPPASYHVPLDPLTVRTRCQPVGAVVGHTSRGFADPCVAPQTRLKMLLRQRLEAAGWGEEMQDYLRGTCKGLDVCSCLVDIFRA